MDKNERSRKSRNCNKTVTVITRTRQVAWFSSILCCLVYESASEVAYGASHGI